MSTKQKEQYPRSRYNSYQYGSSDKVEDFSEYRVITKNLVYVIGLSSSIANRDKLIKYEYFGQYGSIQKIVVNKNKAYNQNGPNGPSYSAYVTFSKPSEASIAILSLDDTIIDNHCVRASFGTTKYCAFFLKGIECNNKDCLFLHKFADENDIIKRGDLNSNKYIFSQQHSYAIKTADIYNPEVKRKLYSIKKCKTVFPAPYLIYRNIYVIENDPYNKKVKNSYLNPIISANNATENSESNKEEKVASSTNSSSSKEETVNSKGSSSRFDFIISNKEECEITVPEEIKNIISKNMNLFSLTKFMKQNYSAQFLEENLYDDNTITQEIKNDWISFNNTDFSPIKPENTNKAIDEFSYDFDRINNFIIDKCDSDNNKEKKQINN